MRPARSAGREYKDGDCVADGERISPPEDAGPPQRGNVFWAGGVLSKRKPLDGSAVYVAVSPSGGRGSFNCSTARRTSRAPAAAWYSASMQKWSPRAQHFVIAASIAAFQAASASERLSALSVPRAVASNHCSNGWMFGPCDITSYYPDRRRRLACRPARGVSGAQGGASTAVAAAEAGRVAVTITGAGRPAAGKPASGRAGDGRGGGGVPAGGAADAGRCERVQNIAPERAQHIVRRGGGRP